MSYEKLEIRQWVCDYWTRGGCEATAVTIGSQNEQGIPEGWVYTYGNGTDVGHYCSEEHARSYASDAVHPRRAVRIAQPFAFGGTEQPDKDPGRIPAETET